MTAIDWLVPFLCGAFFGFVLTYGAARARGVRQEQLRAAVERWSRVDGR